MSETLTFLCGVYNEEARIEGVLRHATQWADEIVVINKSSTDRTPELARQFPRVRVVDVPFLPAGNDPVEYYLSFASNDWVFIGTASEIPTRKLVKAVRDLLALRGSTLDVINVPRKMYSMGVVSQESPWSVSYYPFCVNRKTAVISDRIHKGFGPSAPGRLATIPYSEDVCVHHLTHVTAKAYVNSMAQYFEAEAAGSEDPVGDLNMCFDAIASWEKRLRKAGPELMGAYCAWPLYQLGKALFLWEKARGANVPAYYQELREALLRFEWEGLPTDPPPAPPILNYSRLVGLGMKYSTPWPIEFYRKLKHSIASAPGIRYIRSRLRRDRNEKRG